MLAEGNIEVNCDDAVHRGDHKHRRAISVYSSGPPLSDLWRAVEYLNTPVLLVLILYEVTIEERERERGGRNNNIKKKKKNEGRETTKQASKRLPNMQKPTRRAAPLSHAPHRHH